jgi:hypothetical protein
MWKRLGLGAALLLILGGGLILIDRPVISEPVSAAANNSANKNTAARRDSKHRRVRRHQRHRRGRRR